MFGLIPKNLPEQRKASGIRQTDISVFWLMTFNVTRQGLTAGESSGSLNLLSPSSISYSQGSSSARFHAAFAMVRFPGATCIAMAWMGAFPGCARTGTRLSPFLMMSLICDSLHLAPIFRSKVNREDCLFRRWVSYAATNNRIVICIKLELLISLKF